MLVNFALSVFIWHTKWAGLSHNYTIIKNAVTLSQVSWLVKQTNYIQPVSHKTIKPKLNSTFNNFQMELGVSMFRHYNYLTPQLLSLATLNLFLGSMDWGC